MNPDHDIESLPLKELEDEGLAFYAEVLLGHMATGTTRPFVTHFALKKLVGKRVLVRVEVCDEQ